MDLRRIKKTIDMGKTSRVIIPRSILSFRVIFWHILFVLLETSLVWSDDSCPVNDTSACECAFRAPFPGAISVDLYITCSDLGSQSQLPGFLPTTYRIKSVEIRASKSQTSGSNASRISTVQNRALQNVKPEIVRLSYLNIETVQADALVGLEGTLREMYLEGNLIKSVPNETFSRLKYIEFIGIQYNKLSVVPDFTNLLTLSTLYLQYNYLTQIPRNSFSGLSNLDTLDLSHNLLTDLPPDFLIGASRLKTLNLAGNRLNAMTAGAFPTSTSLVSLDLSSNSLETIPWHLVAAYTSLESFSLASNSISEIDSLHTLTRLRVLNMDNNKFRAIPIGAFQEAANLTRVSFSSNQISDLPPGLFADSPRLQFLNISYNGISSLPVDLLGTRNNQLNYLDVSYNLLSAFPPELLIRLPNLLQLILSNNNLTNFTDGGLIPTASPSTGVSATLPASKIDRLDISYNRLKQFDSALVAKFPSLKELRLDHNLIQTLEKQHFDENTQLRELGLSYNRLKSLPARLGGISLQIIRLNNNEIAGTLDGTSVFSDCSGTLLELYMANNSIESVNRETFWKLNKLAWLDLRYNRLQTIEAGTFGYTTSLGTLRLGGNRLQNLTDLSLRGPTNLNTLDLSENLLQSLPKPSSTLQSIYLSGNPFDCACELLWARSSASIVDANSTYCTTDRAAWLWYYIQCNPVKDCDSVSESTYIHPDNSSFCDRSNGPVVTPPSTTTTTTTTTTTRTTTTTTTTIITTTTTTTTTITATTTTTSPASTESVPVAPTTVTSTATSKDNPRTEIINISTTGISRLQSPTPSDSTISVATSDQFNNSTTPKVGPVGAVDRQDKTKYIIIGAVIGGVLLIVILIVVIVLLVRCLSGPQDDSSEVATRVGSSGLLLDSEATSGITNPVLKPGDNASQIGTLRGSNLYVSEPKFGSDQMGMPFGGSKFGNTYDNIRWRNLADKKPDTNPAIIEPSGKVSEFSAGGDSGLDSRFMDYRFPGSGLPDSLRWKTGAPAASAQAADDVTYMSSRQVKQQSDTRSQVSGRSGSENPYEVGTIGHGSTFGEFKIPGKASRAGLDLTGVSSNWTPKLMDNTYSNV